MIGNYIWGLHNGFISELSLICVSLAPQNSCKFSTPVGFTTAFCCQYDIKQQEHPDESVFLPGILYIRYISLHIGQFKTSEISCTDQTM